MIPQPPQPSLLSFAARSRLDEGFGYLLSDGSVDHARGLETWINARMTHSFGLAVLAEDLLDTAQARDLVAHGVAALRGPLRDAAHDGWFRSTTDLSKAAYEHAFVLLAGATAAVAEVDDCLVREALAVWDDWFWDEEAGAVVETYASDWTGLEEYRGANSNMHGVEAMLAAADALPDRANELRRRALRASERFVHLEAARRAWRLPEHFDSSWVAQLQYNVAAPADPFRPFGVTVGHQFEWARLAVQLQAVLDTPPTWLLSDAEALYSAAVSRGWAADGHPGFVYTLDWEDRPVVTARMHWVLAEAISAAYVLGRDHDARRWEVLAERVFLDPMTRNWHHELSPTGAVASETWSGQPDAYHLLQSQLFSRIPVRGSVAAGLLA